MEAKLDPYRDWLGIVEPERPLNYYQLLRLAPFEADRGQIERAIARQTAALEQHTSGPDAKLAKFAFFELESAKRCLLDADNKLMYDDSLRSANVESVPAARSGRPQASDGSSRARAASQPAAAGGRSGPVLPRPRAISDMLDEVMPREVMPVASPNQAALQIPERRDRPGSEARKNALTVALVITLPIIAILAIGIFGSALLDSHLKTAATGPRQGPESAPVTPPVATGGRVPQRAQPLGTTPNENPNSRPSAPAPTASAPIGPPANDNVATNPAGLQPGADSPDAPAIEREPVPDAAAIAAAAQKVRNAYSREFREAQTPLNNASLANALATDADTSSHDTDYRYALLDAARGAAIAAQDVRLFDRIVNQMAARFDIDALGLKYAGLCQLFTLDQDGESRRELIKVSVTTADRLRDADRYDEAVKLTQLAFDAGSRFEEPLTTKYLGIRVKELADSQARFTLAKQAQATLAALPDDPSANARVGEWYWLDKHSRSQAFTYFAKAGDYDLRWAVVEAQTFPEEPARQVKLADAWLKLAHKREPGQLRTAMLHESLDWYKKAQSQDGKLVSAKQISDLENEINPK